MSSGALSRRQVDKQYRPNGYGLSPGLQRARAPFRVRNALTGVVVGSFAVGVWAYSIRAVKQDTFDDVDEEAKAMLGSRLDDANVPVEAAIPLAQVTTVVQTATASGLPIKADNTTFRKAVISGETSIRGVLASQLAKHYPKALDPVSKTFIWGAPPVDRLGRIGDDVDKRT